MGRTKPSTLPPKVEERLRAFEAQQKQVEVKIKSLEDSIDQVIAEVEDDDEEDWDDPSIVRDAEGVNLAASHARHGT